MRTLAIVPTKSFELAKQRLAGTLGAGSRRALAQAMFCDVLASLRRARRLDAVAVVTADHGVEAVALGERVSVLREGVPSGQSAAAQVGIRNAVSAGYHRVLLVPGDTPLVDAAELDLLLQGAAADGLQLVIVPDRHRTGTNALLMSPPDALPPSFGEGSLARHRRAAREAGLKHRVQAVRSLALDVDGPDDLAELAARLDHHRGAAPRTRGALRQIDRVRSGMTVPAPPPHATQAVEV